jgi:hypothetical protein
MLGGMNPRIEIREVRLRTKAGSHTDHFEAVYKDSAGKELYRGEHPKFWVLAFSELQQKMQQAGYRIEDLPKPHRLSARYLG